MSMMRAARRYVRRYLAGILIYAVLTTGATWIVKRFDLEGPAVIALSMLSALPIAGVMGVFGRYLIEETDEYVRQLVVTAMLFSVGVLLSLSTALGFLQQRGALGTVELIWAFPAWCVIWAVAELWLRWRDHRRTLDEA